ncbi:putative multidrug resistance protein MDR [Acephala macrosclerotiorum]|nr:putative multidrug resistance protein MDR [Acephala macrosclerotiorum]
MDVVTAANINDFGPRRDGSFDFTLLFEQSVLSILPSTLFLGISSLRIAWLFRQEIHARSGGLLTAKLFASTILFCLQLALVALWTMHSTLQNRVTLAAAILALIDSCVIMPLVYAEHKRSIKPSIVLGVYLALSTLLDLAQGRSLFLQGQVGSAAVAGLFVATLATKLTLLLLEELSKHTLLISKFQDSAVESTSGPINRAIFWWINQLFFKGFRILLGVGDLGSIDKKFSSNLLLSKLCYFWDKSNKPTKHSLLTSTLSAFKVAFIAPIFPRLCLAGLSFAQPFLVNRVIDFVGQTSNDESSGIAGGLIGATALVYMGIAISRCLYNHLIYQLITMLRGGLASLIFQRSMELSAAAADYGAAITLMSTDIEGIADGIKEMHEIWANVFELGVAVYLLQLYIGSACFVAVIPAVVCSIITSYSTEGIGPARGEWNSGVEKRVSTTSSMLAQIKGLKMMGLTDYMSELIQNLRVAELECSKKFRMFIVRIILITNFGDQMTPAVVVLAAVLWTQTGPEGFTVSKAFTSLSIVNLVALPVSSLVGSYPTFVSSLACFNRIQLFLNSDQQNDERKCNTSLSGGRKTSSDVVPTARVFSQPEYTFSNVETQELPSKGLADSTGNTIIELEHASFTIKDKTEPILRDISISIERSSLTMIVGPVGSGKSSMLKAILGEIPISCGNVRVQQSRGSIAYCDQTAWLRNLSVRDNIVGQSEFDQDWFTSVINACSLQQDTASFSKGDKTLVGSGGISLSGGQKQRVALARAIYSRDSIVLLDDIFSALDPATSRMVFDRVLGPDGLLRQSGTTVILTTHAVSLLPSSDCIIVLDKTGGIEQSGSLSHLQASDGYIKELALQARLSPAAENEHQEQPEIPTTDSEISPMSAEEDAWKRQLGDLSLYRFYLKSVGTLFAVVFVFLAIAYIFISRMPQIWLRIWTERGTNTDREIYSGAYISFCLAAIIFSGLVVWWFFVVIIPKSATHLHWLLLDAVLKAPLWFFTTTDSGITLNRFSQDMTLFDQKLPIAFFETTLDSLDVVAGTALIASGAQYVGAVIPLCFVPLYFLQKIYLRTSRQMRHLDLEAKSPLYRHFTETLNGVVTIRAFGWRPSFLKENHRLLDDSQKPYYLLFCIQRWLAVVMDLFVAGIATVLVAFAVEFTHTTSRGAIGLAMINIIGFNTSLSRLINSWTNLETSLGAAARLRDFLRDTPKEDKDYSGDLPSLPKDWPSLGDIELGNVSAKYQLSSEMVLRDASLRIKPGQKVGICGRTGSGKSSLLLTILRLLETPTGSLYIDGLDLSSIPVNTTRSRLTTLPQDPVKLPGTVRDNLDPFKSIKSDDDLVSALTKVNMYDAITTRGGLDVEFDTLSLSHGQQQLFCLARTLLHKSKVVLMDEATSSVDQQTDEEVQKALKSEFADCTVLAVAHRLETIGNSDVVVVVDQGRIVEVGNPQKLREDPGSLFKALWENRHG